MDLHRNWNLVRDQEVGGSNPLAPTIPFNVLWWLEHLVFRLHVVGIVGGGILWDRRGQRSNGTQPNPSGYQPEGWEFELLWACHSFK